MIMYVLKIGKSSKLFFLNSFCKIFWLQNFLKASVDVLLYSAKQ